SLQEAWQTAGLLLLYPIPTIHSTKGAQVHHPQINSSVSSTFPMYETGLFGNLHELTERNNKRLENGNPSEQVQPSPTSPMSEPTHCMIFMGVSVKNILWKPS